MYRHVESLNLNKEIFFSIHNYQKSAGILVKKHFH